MALHPDITKPWSQVFLDGLTAIPLSRIKKSFDVQNEPRLLDSNKIKYGRLLRPSSSEHPMSIRLACVNNNLLIVKQFDDFIDAEAKAQLHRRPVPGYSLEQVKRDMDPFILEQQAYERIESVCSEGEKQFFPKYYGTIGKHKETERAISLELLRSSLRSKCICSNSVPSNLMDDLQLLRADIKAFGLGSEEDGTKVLLLPLEIQWYESLFLDRLKRLTALHSVGITHGDIKEDHFRLPRDFHDSVLFDFSRAYTFTPQRPYMVNAHTIYSSSAHRLSTFRSLQRIIQMERNHVRELIRDRIQDHSFRNYFSVHYDLTIGQLGQLASHSALSDLDLIAMKVYRTPDEFGFPSLASLLPFLEEVSSVKASSWIVSQLSSLSNYIAVWIESSSSSRDVNIISLVSWSGEALHENYTNLVSVSVIQGARKNYLLLIPDEWVKLRGLKISPQLAMRVLLKQPDNRKAWTVDMALAVNRTIDFAVEF